jgi:ribosomal protein S13
MNNSIVLLYLYELFDKEVRKMHRSIDPYLLYQPMRFGLVFLGKDIRELENVFDFEKRVVNFPIWKVFFQFYGVNKFFSFYVCERIGINPLILYCYFPRNNSMFLLEKMVVGLLDRCDRALHRHVLITCAVLVALKCRRGKRHSLSRTTRGQCTRRNGKTAQRQLYNWLQLFENVSSVDLLLTKIGKSSSIHEELRTAVVPFYKKKKREKKKIQVVKSAAVIKEHAKVRKKRAYMAGKVLNEKRPLEQIVRRAFLKKRL